ncbi:MAG: 1-acyl-sn-glycerol-3-phosphate acyltransferase [Bacteroidota bacterium]
MDHTLPLEYSATPYEPVIDRIQDWPIARFYQDKNRILNAVHEDTRNQLGLEFGLGDQDVMKVVEQTMYLEQIRRKENPWKVDPKDEKKFWSQIKGNLVNFEQASRRGDWEQGQAAEVLDVIIDRYAREISNTFRPGTYHFAKRFLPFFFSTLLNASAGKTFKALIHHKMQLQEKVHLLGAIDTLRSLSKKGTVILVPTHMSNVDSILVGWSLHALGLPAFIYGAGLNLFNSKVLAYFMKRLGAYKLDRRKRNPVYLNTLRSYVTYATLQGVHGIFFPGGGRIRSGEIEKKLKLGLLGSVIDSQRRMLLPDPKAVHSKVFVVPLVMSYHFVLEARSLINQYLTRTGQESYYLPNDEFSSTSKFLKFVWNSFSRTSEITLSFGQPMDVWGNHVDDNGNSFDHQGRLLDISHYFLHKGEIKKDAQRDREYTRILGNRIVERYHIENYVFSSHIVAFVAFELIKKRFPAFEIYSLLRLAWEDRLIEKDSLYKAVERVLTQLFRLKDQGKVHLAYHITPDIAKLIDHGITNLGIFHPRRPLGIMEDGRITSYDMNLLYYYHNRLLGYGLERLI